MNLELLALILNLFVIYLKKRLEEGKNNEKWYISCVDLIRSRFNSEDMAGFKIQDLEIKRVVRIHNRFLRNKFEEKMESLVDVSN